MTEFTTISIRESTKEDMDRVMPDGVSYEYWIKNEVIPALEGSQE